MDPIAWAYVLGLVTIPTVLGAWWVLCVLWAWIRSWILCERRMAVLFDKEYDSSIEIRSWPPMICAWPGAEKQSKSKSWMFGWSNKRGWREGPRWRRQYNKRHFRGGIHR